MQDEGHPALLSLFSPISQNPTALTLGNSELLGLFEFLRPHAPRVGAQTYLVCPDGISFKSAPSSITSIIYVGVLILYLNLSKFRIYMSAPLHFGKTYFVVAVSNLMQKNSVKMKSLFI